MARERYRAIWCEDPEAERFCQSVHETALKARAQALRKSKEFGYEWWGVERQRETMIGHWETLNRWVGDWDGNEEMTIPNEH